MRGGQGIGILVYWHDMASFAKFYIILLERENTMLKLNNLTHPSMKAKIRAAMEEAIANSRTSSSSIGHTYVHNKKENTIIAVWYNLDSDRAFMFSSFDPYIDITPLVCKALNMDTKGKEL